MNKGYEKMKLGRSRDLIASGARWANYETLVLYIYIYYTHIRNHTRLQDITQVYLGFHDLHQAEVIQLWNVGRLWAAEAA